MGHCCTELLEDYVRYANRTQNENCFRITLGHHSVWLDLLVGFGIAFMNLDAVQKIWIAARTEHHRVKAENRKHRCPIQMIYTPCPVASGVSCYGQPKRLYSCWLFPITITPLSAPSDSGGLRGLCPLCERRANPLLCPTCRRKRTISLVLRVRVRSTSTQNCRRPWLHDHPRHVR